MIRSWILTDDKDRLCFVEVFERDSSLPLVTHVRAIRQIVRAKLANKELIKKRGFVTGPSRGVEDGLVRIVERVQLGGEEFKGVFPTQWLVVSRIAIQQHRMRKPSLCVEPLIRLLGEFGNTPLLKKLRRDALGRRL